jgi:hypothetical protein
MTAEEFLIRQGCVRIKMEDGEGDFFEDVETKDLIEFAKLHVEAALQVASEKAITESAYGLSWVKLDSILNAYTLENIK